MSVAPRETVHIPMTSEMKRRFERAAMDLHLSNEAFLAYLMERVTSGVDSARLDRHVNDVFGQHGELIRRLAK